MSRWDRDDLESIRDEIRGRATKIRPRSHADYGEVHWAIARRFLARAAYEGKCFRADFLNHEGNFHHGLAEATLARIRRDHPAWFAEAMDDAAEEVRGKTTATLEGGRNE